MKMPLFQVGSEPEERSDGEGSRDSSCSPVRRPPSPPLAQAAPKTPTSGPPKTPTGQTTQSQTNNARSPGSAELTNGVSGGPQHKRLKVRLFISFNLLVFPSGRRRKKFLSLLVLTTILSPLVLLYFSQTPLKSILAAKSWFEKTT